MAFNLNKSHFIPIFKPLLNNLRLFEELSKQF